MGGGDGWGALFPRLLKLAVLNQPTVYNKEVSMRIFVAVTVGCWTLALQRSRLALQRNFNHTSTEPQQHFTSQNKKNNYIFFLADVDIFFYFEYYHEIFNMDKDGGTSDVDKVYCIFNAF